MPKNGTVYNSGKISQQEKLKKLLVFTLGDGSFTGHTKKTQN